MMPDPLEALRLPIIPVEPRPEFAASLLRRLARRAGPGTAARPSATSSPIWTPRSRSTAMTSASTRNCGQPRSSPCSTTATCACCSACPARRTALPDGTLPDPGGWNRIVLQVPDLAAAVDALRARGVRFRHEIVTAVGVRQTLLEDPSGNLVELFEPHRRLPRAAPRGGQ